MQRTYTPRHHIRGFTLIETLVAISILVVAVAAPLTLASQSLFAALYAKDQTTAFYLAQEAVEMVRNKRDQNLLAYLNDGTTDWLAGIPTDSALHVDVPNDTMVACVGDCLDTKLLHNDSFYNHEAGEATRFSRSVRVTPNEELEGEATITVMVQWQTGSFQERTFTLEERIYNWLPN